MSSKSDFRFGEDRRDDPPVRFNHPIVPLEAREIERADGRHELTLCPAGAGRHEIVTTWLTAVEGSYLDLRRCR